MPELRPRQKFAELLSGGAGDGELADLIPDLEAASETEEAYLLLRSQRPEATLLLRRLSERLAAGLEARRSGWQQDTHRVRLRLRYARTGAAAALLPPAFLAALVDTFLKGGWRLALGLEKRPRPLVTLGHPLPLGTEGLDECLDVVLASAPPEPDPLPSLNRAAPPGLAFLTAEALPDHASSALDLSRSAEWRWPCPPELREAAQERIASFLAADTFQIEKTGKEDGRKQLKRIEVRDRVLRMAWTAADLHMDTRIDAGQALHPARLLGGILGLEPDRIRGLVRTRLHLAADPRLDQAERFEPKLRNMFEDAVLLKSGPSLQVFDDDEGEPLRLG